MVRSLIKGDRVLDIACGGQKILPTAIGIDIMPKGELVPGSPGNISQADIAHDVTTPLPFEKESFDTIVASHIIEHLIDTVGIIKMWGEYLKPGGRLILAAPDERITRGIVLNIEHCHAFTTESIKNIVELCGFKEIEGKPTGNRISFVSCFEKVGDAIQIESKDGVSKTTNTGWLGSSSTSFQNNLHLVESNS